MPICLSLSFFFISHSLPFSLFPSNGPNIKVKYKKEKLNLKFLAGKCYSGEKIVIALDPIKRLKQIK